MDKWYVTGFDAHGNILLQTWHTSMGSAQIEVEVWKDRIRKDDDPAVRCQIMHPGPPMRTTDVKWNEVDKPIDWGSS